MTDRSFEDSGRDLTHTIGAAASSAKPLKEPLGEHAMECETHGAYIASGVRFLGFRDVWTGCADCEKTRVAAERRAEAEREAERAQARIETMLGRAAIPKRFRGRSLDNFVATTKEQKHAQSVAVEYAANLSSHVERGDSLIFSGLPGTGKSHLGTAIQQAGMPNVSSMYVTSADMVRSVRATWSRGSDRSEVDVLREFGMVELLVIDEVGVMGGSDNEKALIFEILDRRYRDLKPTILLTNLAKDGFRAYVGDRVFDRLTETARWVSFDWASYRPAARHSGPSNDSQFSRNATGVCT